jgi:hypothetical protein
MTKHVTTINCQLRFSYLISRENNNWDFVEMHTAKVKRLSQCNRIIIAFAFIYSMNIKREIKRIHFKLNFFYFFKRFLIKLKK